MMTKMTFDQFLDFVNGFSGDYPEGMHIGQWAWQCLDECHPDIAMQIGETDFDPFNDDSRMRAFLCKLLQDFVE